MTGMSPPPSQYRALSDVDRRPFDFFLSRAAPKLGGPFDQEFWTRDVLQKEVLHIRFVWFQGYRFKQEKHTSTIVVVVGKTGKAKSADAERVASMARAKTRQQDHVVMRVCSRAGELRVLLVLPGPRQRVLLLSALVVVSFSWLFCERC